MPGRFQTWYISQEYVPAGHYRLGDPIPEAWDDFLELSVQECLFQDAPPHFVAWLDRGAKAAPLDEWTEVGEIAGVEEDPEAHEVALHHSLWLLFMPGTGRVHRVFWGYEPTVRPKEPSQHQPLRLAPPVLPLRRLDAVPEEPKDPPSPGAPDED